jgi:radical SAM superfamily enzyme YgiQ (UPF0313 family)
VYNIFQLYQPKDNTQYYIFLRSEKHINKILEDLLVNHRDYFPNLTLGLGIDFLGNRMLNFMNKGYTVEDILETLRIMREHNILAAISTIIRWPNLTEEDLKEVEQYVQHKEIQNCKSTFCINNLITKPNTPLANDPRFKGNPMLMGPFFMSWFPNLDKKTEDISNKIRDLIIQNAPITIDRSLRHINQPYSY